MTPRRAQAGQPTVTMERVAGRWWWVRRDCYGRVAAMAASLESVRVLDVAVVTRRGAAGTRR
ncbi:hypothetical protein E1262_00795 [Jiangella aurantiaca]|uniref:Uncharacterized protein n=1 Tax=Jiangella aurantiaca TaxID=2530373 RepID=A0A4R5AJQ4_9ACTN|nr:hypothetical protein [Jiangella aurantiaca]TDD73058.1 hypothetical protein E1262_00795 [Jiangella aurantiaca]